MEKWGNSAVLSNSKMKITELKRRQLHLKHEIERLRHETTARGERDELLDCRMAMLGLDPDLIESCDRETFDQIMRS